jgi:hypothetical protein
MDVSTGQVIGRVTQRHRAKEFIDFLRQAFRCYGSLRWNVMKCPLCGNSLRILSVITQPDVIERILHPLDLPTKPPSSSRAPPVQVDLPWDDGCM